MIVKVTNFRGISRAEIRPRGVTLIAGPNAAGKTSTLQAIVAGTTSKSIPIEGLAKTHGAQLVHSGTAMGEIIIETPVGESRVTYPDASRTSTGIPLEISEYAAGVKSILDEPKKSRGELLSDVLKTAPTEVELEDEIIAQMLDPTGQKQYRAIANLPPEDMKKTLQANPIAPDMVSKITGIFSSFRRLWSTIVAQGWDAAWEQVKQTGTKLKGQWEQITAERYGTAKAAGWMPKEWDADLTTATAERLEIELKQEREWLEVAMTDQAVNEAEIARLQGLADNKDTLKKAVEEANAAKDALLTNDAQIAAGIRNLPPAEQPKTCACPHCQQPVMITGTELRIPKLLTEEELAARAKVIADCNASLTSVRNEITKQTEVCSAAAAQYAAAQSAAAQLSKIKAKPAPTGNSRGVEDCRNRVQRAENRLAAFRKKTDADRIHASIVQNQSIIDILAPSGIRQRNLKTKLTALNAQLVNICTCAGWGIVEVKPDMVVTYGGTPCLFPKNPINQLIAESELWRTEVALQIAIAQLESAPLILIDGADVLVGANRNGLMKLLFAVGIPTIVGMSIPDRAKVPNLSAAGGISYWVENGTAEELYK